MPTALPHYAFTRGAIAVIPLSLACAPWGLLAGSMAIDAQFTPLQAQGLSAIVFAGAAQLVAIGMVKSHLTAHIPASALWHAHASYAVFAQHPLAHEPGVLVDR